MGLISACFLNPTLFIIFYITLSILTLNKKKLFISLQITLAIFLMIKSGYNLPNMEEGAKVGTIYFKISSITKSNSNFKSSLVYRGSGKLFKTIDGDIIGKNFPCAIRWPIKAGSEDIKKNGIYLIRGTLKSTKTGSYFFTPDKMAVWHPVKTLFNLAYTRYRVKETIKRYVASCIPEKKTKEFLSGIITGDFEDKIMQDSFSSLGLSHIMAISGFHFAIIAGICSYFLRFFLPQKYITIALTTLLSAYFLLIGPSPSILRAWAMCLITLFGFYSERPAISLNSLGVAILLIIFFDPMQCFSIGFIFSFLVTASILIWFEPINNFLDIILEKRPLSQILEMNIIDQHFYLTLAMAKKIAALSIAINIFAMPLTLFFFHRFPTLSLIYNLFIPFLVSISIFLFLLATIFYFSLPFLGVCLHMINANFTHFMLNFIYNVPTSLNFFIRVQSVPLSFIISYLILLFFLGIMIRERFRIKHSLVDQKSFFF